MTPDELHRYFSGVKLAQYHMAREREMVMAATLRAIAQNPDVTEPDTRGFRDAVLGAAWAGEDFEI